jgi:hypothetical protein
MHDALTGKQPVDFSMVLGGPTYQLLRRLHILRPPMDLLSRRMTIIPLIVWLPLLALAVIARRAWGDAVKVPFLYDVDVHVRFLVSLPLLVLAEWLVHMRFRPLIAQFVERDIVVGPERERFEQIITSSMRLRNSIVAELILVLLVCFVGPWTWRSQAAIHSSTWYADVNGSDVHLTLPGVFYRFAALPIFQFILLRWYLRLFIWYRFLWKVSRLNLNLLPTHPDGAGGLGFLAGSAHAMSPLLVAQSALLAGLIANRIFYEGAKLPQFKLEIMVIVAFLVLQVLGPLLVFIPSLATCQRVGSRAYGDLASQYTADFHRKWIVDDSHGNQELLGSADIQSLADLANSFGVIRSMSVVPFTKMTVIRLAVISILPLLPLALTILPLDQLLEQIIKVLL